MKFKFFLCLLCMAVLVLNCKSNNDDDESVPQAEAFTYSTFSSMSTGSTSKAGTVSPAGYTWSEVKAPQTSWGSNGTITDYVLADDFQIPSGEKWTIENIYFYSYQSGFSGTVFPINEVYFEIYSSDPSVAGAVKIYGDTTTNRYVSAEETKLYRILEGEPDGTTRKIYKIKTQTSDLNLSSGTYCIKWGSKTSSGAHYYPQLPHDANKINNAKQFTIADSSWNNLQIGGQNISFPFEITGTKLTN